MCALKKQRKKPPPHNKTMCLSAALLGSPETETKRSDREYLEGK